MTDRPRASNILPRGVHAAGRCFQCGNWTWSWTPRAWSLAVRAACPLRPQGLVIRGGCNVVATERVNFLFADGRALYGDALEMLAQGKIRNAAEKAWGATKRATDALAMARHGEEPQSAGQTLRALLRPSALDPTFDGFQGH